MEEEGWDGGGGYGGREVGRGEQEPDPRGGGAGESCGSAGGGWGVSPLCLPHSGAGGCVKPPILPHNRVWWGGETPSSAPQPCWGGVSPQICPTPRLGVSELPSPALPYNPQVVPHMWGG